MKQLILIVSLILLCFIQFNKMNETDSKLFTQNNGRNLIKTDNTYQIPVSQNLSDSKLNTSGNISHDWYSAAIEKISLEEYNITYNEKLNTYQSPNRANNIRFTYHKDGFKAAARETKIPLFDANDRNIRETDRKYKEVEDWNVDLIIKDNATGITNEDLTSAGNKAWIENENIRIDYTNTKEGMRQDFIVKKKLSDENDLSLTINANTSLKMTVRNDAVSFSSNDGSEKMQYASLKAWDANLKELNAYFEKTDDKQFAIRVDDRDAEYPVTIDPLSLAPDWTMSGIGGRFGWSLADAGDVNGDGYDDVAIGATSYDKVFLYYGSINGLPDTASKILSGDFGFGEVLSSAGDVNSDGFDDLVIQNGGDRTTYVYQGSASGINDTASWYLAGNDSGIVICCGDPESIGFGDFNGDGYDDIVIGTGEPQNYLSHNVGAYVFLGSAQGITGNQPAWTASTSQEINLYGMGWSVSGAGDVNGDGYDDVIVGAPFNSQYGKALVYYGSPDRPMFAPADWENTDSNYNNQLGLSVSSACDVNNDGYDDIVIGSPPAGWGNTDTGIVYVYFGSSSGLNDSDLVIIFGEPSIGGYGYSVSGVPDFNGDGFDEVVVGEGYFNGGAFLYFGNSISINTTPVSLQGYGVRVSGAGDVNGDGYSDIITGGEPSANAFYGAADILYSVHVTPKQTFLQSNTEYCCTTYARSQYRLPVDGMMIQFNVHGRNTLSASVPSDINGMSQFCYISEYSGFDTIIVSADNIVDTAYVSWDFPLPVELSSFTSSVSERNVTLNWSTTSETNNSGFDIERAVDNGQKIIENGQLIIDSWSKAGFVEGNGTVNEPKNYSFTDKNLQTGNYKYRLKQTDFNGNYEYYYLSESVSIGIPDKFSLSQNYPNPFNPVTNLEFGIPELGLVSIKVYDAVGREVETLVNEIKEPGYYTIKFNAANLASGAYFYRMTAGEFVAVKKFVVLK
ncbi:MAG: FG-GAP repeat protein [Ignavibacteriae bacterium]|nr:FG-GAP repeat protein [Ignavibacteriota bacterium]